LDFVDYLYKIQVFNKMKAIPALIISLFFIALQISGQVIYIPEDYPTIQEGINAANEGDTVLVAPGTYYENLSLTGENITMGSYFLTTNDTSYISSTIINGGQNGSVITIYQGEDASTRISGFSITNGKGNSGGGIRIFESDPYLDHLNIYGNSASSGGGIYAYWCQPAISNCLIQGNTATEQGGGIWLGTDSYSWDSPQLTDLVIKDNNAGYGGGIAMDFYIGGYFNGITVCHNTAGTGGGILFGYYGNVVFNPEHRCNIYQNSAAVGNDLYSHANVDVIVDTFTVMNPTEFHASEIEEFTFDILNSKLEQVEYDLYISPEGDNNNSGLTADDPLRTIHHALTILLASESGQRQIHLLDGIYSPETNGEFFPVSLPDYVHLSGTADSLVILDADSTDRVMQIRDNDTNYVSDLTLCGGLAESGAGIYIYYSDPCLERLIIRDNSSSVGNYSKSGGGISGDHSEAILKDIIIAGNYAQSSGGGLYFTGSSPVLQNICILNNTAGSGGGLYLSTSTERTICDQLSVLENHASNGAGILNYGFLELRNSIINANVSGNAGGGIYSRDSIWIFNSNLVNNTSGSGGGLYVYANSYALLDSSELSGNHAIGGGGGLCCGTETVVYLNHVKINSNLSNNTAGGIFTATTGLHIKKSDITYNHADNYGGGIYCDDEAFPQFDSTDRCNLFLNWAGTAKDIFTKDGMVNVILDTFTVLHPTDYFVNDPDDFTFDILAGKVEQAYADLYVSTVGSDTNSGFSSDNPLKTIDRALMILRSDSLNQHSIHLADGIYSGSSNGEKFPLQLSDYCSLEGETRDGTILDAEDSSHVLNLYHDHIPEIKNLTLTGGHGMNGGGLLGYRSVFNLFNVKIRDNTSNYQGGGVYVGSGSIAELNHVVFENNESGTGGGIDISYSSAHLKNIDFTHNQATDGGGIYISYPDTLTMDHIYCFSNTAENYGGAIYARNSDFILANAVFDSNQAYRGGGFCLESSSMDAKNTLFVRNTAADGYGGAGTIYNYGAPPDAEVNFYNATCTQNTPPVLHIYGGKASLTNSILWDNNNPIQIYYFVDYSESDTLTISYSDIQSAQAGIFKSGGAVLDWNAGNINEDPQFSMGDEYPFSLDAGSPCIDAGTPDTTGLLLPYNDLIGNVRVWDGDADGISIIDMGPYEYGAPVTVDDSSFPEAGKKIHFTLYPNPAKDHLTIQCSDHRGDIIIKLINYSGQIVKVITLPAGLNMTHIPTDHLGTGAYWVLFTDEEGHSTIEKLIISK